MNSRHLLIKISPQQQKRQKIALTTISSLIMLIYPIPH